MLKGFLLFILFYFLTGTTVAQTQKQEATLKAVFIYNFTKYIDWDKGNNENEFVIGVIGSSAIIKPLTEIAKTNTINNKKIVIRRFNDPEDISNCHILFIPGNSPFSLRSILDKLGKGTLTVSEEAGFANEGTAFNFVIINNKLKFEANLKAISSAGLKAGSQLLKLAIIID